MNSSSKRRSALGRPLDPHYPTNRAVLFLLPIAGLLGGVLALSHHDPITKALLTGVSAALAAFSGWALARELSPDDEYAAFGCMALAVATWLALPHASVLLPFLTLMLARMVNRTVGPPASLLDSVVLVVLGGIVAYVARSAAIAGVMAIAFALDALLTPVLRRQWMFVALSVILGIGIAVTRAAYFPFIPGNIRWLLAVIAAVYLASVMATRRIVARSDNTGEPLSIVRVRAAMRLGLLAACTGFLPGLHSLERSALVWAVLLGVAAGRAISLTRPRPPLHTGQNS